MKVLFAVNNEEVSESIIKLYQKEYREIISGKNVYYFNAIIKELQRDQTYDRVVISEDLEPYTNNNFDVIDKFLFEQLDKISDEAISGVGEDIPIIFIASDRRSKSDELLSKLFSIGIYNALLGSDRTTQEVCKLINKPRTKKEAKVYYKIETDEVSYHAETEDSVSETEIQNILTHYKRLGKNTERYVDSFNNIAAQYNDAQLRIISKFLPIGVKAVLEAESTKYQSIMTFGEGTYKKAPKKEEKKNSIKMGFIETKTDKNKPSKPVVIPSAVNKENVKKLNRKKEENITNKIMPEQTSIDELEQDTRTTRKTSTNSNVVSPTVEESRVEEPVIEKQETVAPVEPPKRGRGRPKKQVEKVEEPAVKNTNNTVNTDNTEEIQEVKPKRGRGRPRKQPVDTIQNEKIPVTPVKQKSRSEENVLPGFDEIEENTLPGFDEIEENTLPGVDEIEENTLPGFDEAEENTLPGFDEVEESPLPNVSRNNRTNNVTNTNLYNAVSQKNEEPEQDRYMENATPKQSGYLARLLSRDRKIVAFVGTSKCGTSFLINNLADLIAKSGINTAILDVTFNKNSYYIYTRNEEQLRRKAINCLESLEQNIVDGIEVSKNLTVFTSIPGKKVAVRDIESVLSALAKQYSLVLLDCDFSTPFDYFALAQEIYLVQNMDILNIQPLTAFLRDLQSNNCLDATKLKVVINQAIKVRGLSASAIIGGMSCYNDPEMSYMRDLFNRENIPSIVISFDGEVLSKYLSGMVDCIVTINGYTKQFINELKRLADMVYPLINSKLRTDYKKHNKFAKKNKEARESENSFSKDMTSTLDNMKKRFK